jgi:hypothetical protein
MPSGFKITGLHAPSDKSAALPLAMGKKGQAPDTALSSAFRNVLGSGAHPSHLATPELQTGHEIAKRAKADKPAANLKGSTRNAHVGPRSGHK